MKEYRLTSWPELPADFQKTAHRRVLSELSSRHVGVEQLVEASGLRRQDVRALIELLDGQGLLVEREADDEAAAARLAAGRFGWLRRSVSASPWRD